jgi:hypothetical protein
MFVQIVSKNNIDNFLLFEANQREKLVLFYSSKEAQAFELYQSKLYEKFLNGTKIEAFEYDSLENLMAKATEYQPNYFQFNDMMIAESLAVVNGLDREKTEVLFFQSTSSETFSYTLKKINNSAQDTSVLTVSDYIQLVGGDIEMVNDDVFDRLIKDGSFDMIIDDPYHWRQFSRAFVDTNTVIENSTKPLFFTVKFKTVQKKLDKHFRAYVKHFVDKGYFKTIAGNEDRAIFRYKDPAYKSFFKLSGSWLELITYKAVKELQMDDIDASVLFTWDSKIKNFENEIDLLAVKNGKLLFISCKDTKKVNKEYLNEIIVNSSELGDDNVTKALVTTSHMIYDSFLARAEELGIALILYKGNFDTFKDEIAKLIK